MPVAAAGSAGSQSGRQQQCQAARVSLTNVINDRVLRPAVRRAYRPHLQRESGLVGGGFGCGRRWQQGDASRAALSQLACCGAGCGGEWQHLQSDAHHAEHQPASAQ